MSKYINGIEEYHKIKRRERQKFVTSLIKDFQSKGLRNLELTIEYLTNKPEQIIKYPIFKKGWLTENEILDCHQEAKTYLLNQE